MDTNNLNNWLVATIGEERRLFNQDEFNDDEIGRIRSLRSQISLFQSSSMTEVLAKANLVAWIFAEDGLSGAIKGLTAEVAKDPSNDYSVALSVVRDLIWLSCQSGFSGGAALVDL